MSEKISSKEFFKCQFCRHVFLTEEDLNSHLEAFGHHAHYGEGFRVASLSDKGFDVSLSAKIKKYGILGYCCKNPKKLQVVANTVDAVILCPGCKHFRFREKSETEKRVRERFSLKE